MECVVVGSVLPSKAHKSSPIRQVAGLSCETSARPRVVCAPENALTQGCLPRPLTKRLGAGTCSFVQSCADRSTVPYIALLSLLSKGVFVAESIFKFCSDSQSLVLLLFVRADIMASARTGGLNATLRATIVRTFPLRKPISKDSCLFRVSPACNARRCWHTATHARKGPILFVIAILGLSMCRVLNATLRVKLSPMHKPWRSKHSESASFPACRLGAWVGRECVRASRRDPAGHLYAAGLCRLAPQSHGPAPRAYGSNSYSSSEPRSGPHICIALTASRGQARSRAGRPLPGQGRLQRPAG